jgi:hypothetical protein
MLPKAWQPFCPFFTSVSHCCPDHRQRLCHHSLSSSVKSPSNSEICHEIEITCGTIGRLVAVPPDHLLISGILTTIKPATHITNRIQYIFYPQNRSAAKSVSSPRSQPRTSRYNRLCSISRTSCLVLSRNHQRHWRHDL